MIGQGSLGPRPGWDGSGPAASKGALDEDRGCRGRDRRAWRSRRCLAQDGHTVTVFDQFEAPRPVGSGLVMQPVGLEVLDRVGAGAALRQPRPAARRHVRTRGAHGARRARCRLRARGGPQGGRHSPGGALPPAFRRGTGFGRADRGGAPGDRPRRAKPAVRGRPRRAVRPDRRCLRRALAAVAAAKPPAALRRGLVDGAMA